MKYDFFSFCHFGVDQPFCYVVCEHLHNVDEGASYLSLLCYRPVSLTKTTFFKQILALPSKSGLIKKEIQALYYTNQGPFNIKCVYVF